MAKTAKKVNFRVDRGIRINGESIFPAKGKAKPVVIGIGESLAKELAAASKGAIVSDKPTKQLVEKSAEDAELDAAFGSEEGEE
ncbi:hypothetical protein GCM10011369_23390 [Neiella marina]|uniref:Uncharacterized protein n=1 Tax=Neiella marina TaxID=508461 RepID=A0A8J2U670_9GAMM|nr:hypothetical protein [Neiella marina]GGA80756.1 hypothetical protein GCM10011369_23390 [Neiella marina]